MDWLWGFHHCCRAIAELIKMPVVTRVGESGWEMR